MVRSIRQAAGPWVSLLAGTPIFYLVCRWIGSRVPSRAWPTAMALFGLFVLQCVVAPIPSEPFMMAAGYVYGPSAGFAIASLPARPTEQRSRAWRHASQRWRRFQRR